MVSTFQLLNPVILTDQGVGDQAQAQPIYLKPLALTYLSRLKSEGGKLFE